MRTTGRALGLCGVIGAVFVGGGVAACSSSETDENSSDEVRAGGCEVAIVGGGAGGLHTAFRLAPTLGSRVCLFEKEKELGGRIHDISFDDQAAADAPHIGVGARRVMETQDVLFNLATELALELEKPDTTADLIDARGVYSFSKDAIAEKAYPTIPASTIADKDRETILYDTLRASPERERATTYPNFETYVKRVVGEEQYHFLRDVSRFRADFEYPLDARGYLDYLDEEWDTCCTPSYPKGGMSAFIRAMEGKATQAGARIFKATPVTRIDRTGDGYSLTTATGTVHANKLVIGVPPVALDKIGGDVADRLKAQAQYKQIIGVRVVTVTQFWDEAWWTVITNPAATANAQVWRAWTTEHCLNFIEIPIEPYAAAQKVTRSVYVDNDKCVSYWEDLAKQGTEAVEADLQKGLTALFNNGGVSVPVNLTVPRPKKTFIQSWPAAWHWLRAGATITNAQLADWALEPLPGEPIALVGEAYNVQRSGWSDAAYKSSIKLLNAKYGQNLAGLHPRSVTFASVDRGHRAAR